MIFDNNGTALGKSVIPMDEGYNRPYGTALALIEGARSDLAMFEAMLSVDARELGIKRGSTGYVAEGELTSLSEAAVGGIWAKIKELFAKLVAKIKAIFHNFMSKINALALDDKQMVKKYEKELIRKANLDKLEVKWCKIKNNKSLLDAETRTAEFAKLDTFLEKWHEETSERVKEFLLVGGNKVDEEDFDQEFHDAHFEDEEELKLSEIGGIRPIMSYLSDFSKKSNTLNTTINKLTTALEKLVKEADRRLIAKKDEKNEQALTDARKVYEVAQAYQTAVLKENQAILDGVKVEYKQYKAAFMKAISANPDKLKESATYLNAVAEAAEQEVEDVISGALDGEELSKICNASKDVKDSDVSDDPDKLTYGPNYYTRNGSYVPTDGTVDSDIVGKSEAAEFSKMFY
jgi:hypothetical protein